MKIILILFLMLSSVSYSEPWKMTISGEAELGIDRTAELMFCQFDLGMNFYFWKCINRTFVGSLTWTEMNWNGMTAYPFREIYYYGNRFVLWGFFVEFKHFCNHPVKSNKLHSNYVTVDGINYYAMNDKWYSDFWGETLTTISIGYEFEFPIGGSDK